MSSEKTLTIPLSKILSDQKYQLRDGLIEDNVERLIQAYKKEAKRIPPILVRQDGDIYRVVDGFHRVEASIRLGRETIKADLVSTEDEKSILAAGVQANVTHGLILTKAEMVRAARAIYTKRIGKHRNKARYPWDMQALAKLFRVSCRTVENWMLESSARSSKKRAASRNKALSLVRQFGEEGLEKAILDQFGADALKRTYDPQVRWSMKDGVPDAPGTPVLMISDWHYGEIVDPEQVFNSNKFNIDIAKKRLEEVCRTAVTLLKQHLAHPTYPGIVLVLGGDIISGSLHEDIAITDQVPPIVQAREAAMHLSDAIAFLASEFPQVSIYGVPGNHGKTTKRPYPKFYAQHNLDWLCYKMIEDYVTGHGGRTAPALKNVTCNFPAARDLNFTVANWRFRLSHGDQFKGGDSQIGPVGPVTRGDSRKRVAASLMPGQVEQYDTLLVGHFHQLWMNQRLIINGSIKGYDEFSLQINVPWEPPQQALLTVHPKLGITWLMPVYCERHLVTKKVKAA